MAIAGRGSFAEAQGSAAKADSGSVAALNPGDKISISVFQMPEISGEFLIDSEGKIAQPLYSTVVATDIGPDTLDSRVRQVVAKYQAHPTFVIRRLYHVGITGNVKQPGVYYVPGETTVADAVAIAGGVTPHGDPRRINLTRDGRATKVDISGASGGTALRTVQSGDQVTVVMREPPRDNIIAVLGYALGIAGIAAIIGSR
jgi:polysaccharide export outer membrane protein